MIRTPFASAAALALALLCTTACVQYPTERQGVVDHRPRIAFRFDAANSRLNDARIVVDGLDSGRLTDFAEGKAALRVLPGTHVVRVVSGQIVLMEQRVYVGDGVARAFDVQ